jgi:adenylate cyclase
MIPDAEFANANILVVDDQAANVRLLEELLSQAGYLAVASTQDPCAVCDLHRQYRYDLILLDLTMPVMDGFKVLEGLKALEPDGYVPVLVVTAQRGHQLRALRAGARDFVSKPFELGEVLARVRNLLEVRLSAKALQRTVLALEASRALLGAKNEELSRLLEQVVVERKRSERLALQAPPGSIAQRLPGRPDMAEDAFAETTVLVADVVGFADAGAAAPESPADPRAQLLQLDEVFDLFDGLAEAHGLKKVKTNGNSFLAVAGVPMPAADHAGRAAGLSLAMLEGLALFNQRTGAALEARIGLGSGALVAGVIGRRLYLYDVWGDAVNAACLMESRGVVGRAQLGEETRRRLGDGFLLEERGGQAPDGQRDGASWLLGRAA